MKFCHIAIYINIRKNIAINIVTLIAIKSTIQPKEMVASIKKQQFFTLCLIIHTLVAITTSSPCKTLTWQTPDWLWHVVQYVWSENVQQRKEAKIKGVSTVEKKMEKSFFLATDWPINWPKSVSYWPWAMTFVKPWCTNVERKKENHAMWAALFTRTEWKKKE